jgi:hypothetical protein
MNRRFTQKIPISSRQKAMSAQVSPAAALRRASQNKTGRGFPRPAGSTRLAARRV